MRYVFLDGLRGVAALAVVVHHFSSSSGRREIFASGPLAVDFFFCLSGFVIALSYHERLLAGMSVAHYLRRRVIRLGPMFLIGMLMGLGAAILLHRHGLTDMPMQAIFLAGALNVFYVPYLNEYVCQIYAQKIQGAIFPLNNPAWSLFYEIVANVVYAVSLRHTRIDPRVWVWTAAVGLCVAAYALGASPGWGRDNYPGGFPRVFFSFFAGVVICRMRSRLAGLPRVDWKIVVLLVVAMLVMPQFAGHQLYWLACALIAVPILVALGARCTIEPGSRLHRVSTYLGLLSYPVYCVHYPLLMVWSALVPLEGRFFAAATAYFAAAIVVAHMTMRHVDEPVRQWLSANRAAT